VRLVAAAVTMASMATATITSNRVSAGWVGDLLRSWLSIFLISFPKFRVISRISVGKFFLLLLWVLFALDLLLVFLISVLFNTVL